jgi:2-dehydropantoate 2-reductase
MRILVVGAGGTGGYFGGRLLESGADVTFLVRPRRAAQLAQDGLIVRSPQGDIMLASPPAITKDQIREPFDLVLLSCKSYDLEDAIASFAPAVGPRTAILPLLNGMRHLDVLNARFPPGAVLGGLAIISVVLGPDGIIRHLNDLHSLTFGERAGGRSERIDAIHRIFASARFDAQVSETIEQQLWEKWFFIAAAAGITTLMRGCVGDIVAGQGGDVTLALVEECRAIATLNGFPPSDAIVQRSRTMLTTPRSPFAASMFRDVERQSRTEGDHILGDLLRRGGDPRSSPVLRIAVAHLETYEARRQREQSAPDSSS